MWHVWQKQIDVLVLFLVGSAALTQGVQTGIICQLMNNAGDVVQTFHQYDCSSCWFHCVMSPTCVKIYYTHDSACHDEESQVESSTAETEEHFRSPSDTCLQLDELFGSPLADDCPPKAANVHRMLYDVYDATGKCTLYSSEGRRADGDGGSRSCSECQSVCRYSNHYGNPPCFHFKWSADDICYLVYAKPFDEPQCPEDDYEFVPLPKPCGGGAYGEPHFRGFGNQHFEFQGFSGGYFNVYSDPAHQVNALLTSIGDPDLTYVGAVGIMYGPNKVKVLVSVDHCIHPQACSLQVQLDDKFVVASEGHGRVTAVEGEVKLQIVNALQGAQHVHVFTPGLAINITKGVGGLHLDLELRVFPGVVAAEQVHGLLGQTIQWPRDPYAHLEGDEMDYATSHLFATDSKFQMYVAANASAWHAHH